MRAASGFALEPLAAHALRDEIKKRFGWKAAVPALGQVAEA